MEEDILNSLSREEEKNDLILCVVNNKMYIFLYIAKPSSCPCEIDDGQATESIPFLYSVLRVHEDAFACMFVSAWHKVIFVIPFAQTLFAACSLCSQVETLCFWQMQITLGAHQEYPLKLAWA